MATLLKPWRTSPLFSLPPPHSVPSATRCGVVHCAAAASPRGRSWIVHKRMEPEVQRAASVASDAITQTSAAFTCEPGASHPLGASLAENGINFALFSQHATSVSLCLYLDPSNTEVPTEVIEVKHRTGNTWHVLVEGLPMRGVLYGYRVDGPKGWEKGHRFDGEKVLLDPYAKLVEGRRVFGDSNQKLAPFFGTYDFSRDSFDWGEHYAPPGLPEKDLVVYEMNVRGFTRDESSGVSPGLRGSYLGLIEKIPHLVELGVNAVELLPVFEYDEFEFQRRKNPRDHMINTWGYSTLNFFAPMSRYASNGGGASAASLEFKQMVRALHNAGIEVILDVVYNHTNEADDEHPYLTSFRGIDNLVYYMVDLNSYVQLSNYGGCGNTFNCNHPVVMELILESLRHWVTEYHVDGFRFDLASILCRGTDGQPLSSPPLIKAITHDPILKDRKLIAEPWDCGGLYLVGRFPNWDKWAEWNGKYRDDVRRFIRGDAGVKGAFATRLSGSADLYHNHNRKPYHSINFVIAHDGFTLYDLVAYNMKHNAANGEGGQDGSNDNLSWNCGVEGETEDYGVKAIRSRQMKNFHLALVVSQGTPMMLMGDEYAHTRLGNNNSYGHDTNLNWFQWKELEVKRNAQFRFFAKTIQFRKEHPLLGRESFLNESDVTWHERDWGNADSRLLAFTLHQGSLGGGDLYVAFNSHNTGVQVHVPSPPHGKAWFRLVDTNLPSPDDFWDGKGQVRIDHYYELAPFSSVVFHAKSD